MAVCEVFVMKGSRNNLEKPKKSQNNRLPGRDLNQVYPEYKLQRVVSTHSCSVSKQQQQQQQ
jgi:hypothetical protein